LELFVVHILKDGFSKKCIWRMQACIMSILVNGSPTTIFKVNRRLCQEDALAVFLF